MSTRTIAQTIGLGLAGGAAGFLAMRLFTRATDRFVKEPAPATRREKRSMSLIGERRREGESPTQALARMSYGKVTGREPTERQKAIVSSAIGWGASMAAGAAYAALRGRRLERPDPLVGAVLGAALWAVGDSLIAPLLGLADKPTRAPLAQHAQTLAGRLAYGAATGAAIGALRGRTMH